MGEESALPRSIRFLGEALRPVAANLNRRMKGAPPPSRREHDALEFISYSMQIMGDEVEAFTNIINYELNKVAGGEVNDAEIWQTAARLDDHIMQMLDCYDEARSAKCDILDSKGISLLHSGYRDVLKQVLDWLNEIIELVDRPLAALRKRGLATDGTVYLTLEMDLKPPPEFDKIVRWSEARTSMLANRFSAKAIDRPQWSMPVRWLFLPIRFSFYVLVGFWLGLFLNSRKDDY